MGYCEIGVGTLQDVQRALKWYEKAAAQGNADARDWLAALAQPTSSPLSSGSTTRSRSLRSSGNARSHGSARTPTPAPIPILAQSPSKTGLRI
ncbi:hypothetical protein DFH11DRAFT_1639258 [Phellopilus nigrolimitatus]|nr:hypothetical protein DFH11DRAFT_1639258 [Phellopilus nigrolimitatus]